MDKLTSKFQMALADAQSLAVGRDHQFVEPAHLLVALLDQEGGAARHLLTQAIVNVNQLRSSLGEMLDGMPSVQGEGELKAYNTFVSNELGDMLSQIDKLSQQRMDSYISSELFLLAALDDKGEIGKLLRQADVSKDNLERAIEQMRGGESVDDPNAEDQRQALEKYTIDLTERDEQGKLDSVIGRDEEIRTTMMIYNHQQIQGLTQSAIVEGGNNLLELSQSNAVGLAYQYGNDCCKQLQQSIENYANKEKNIKDVFFQVVSRANTEDQKIQDLVNENEFTAMPPGEMSSIEPIKTIKDFSSLKLSFSSKRETLINDINTYESDLQRREYNGIGDAIGTFFWVFVLIWVVAGLLFWDSGVGFTWAFFVVGGVLGVHAMRQNSAEEAVVTRKVKLKNEASSLLGKSKYLKEKEIKDAEEQKNTALEKLQREKEHNLPQLKSRISTIVSQLQSRIDDLPLEYLPFSDHKWSSWRPPSNLEQYIRLGKWHKQRLGSEASSVVGNVEPPLLIPARLKHGLFIERHVINRYAITSDLIFKLLTAYPPGKCRFLICDPLDAGDHVSNLFKLKDYDDRILNGKVWTSSNQISEKIEELSDHIEVVIQQYLRNDFKTLDQYHEHIGEMVVPYHVIVLFGFPKGIMEETLDHLVTIAKNGYRCGVSLIVTEGDEENPMRLENIPLLTRELTSFSHITASTQYLHFLPDEPVSSKLSDRIITTIGRTSREGSNLVVDWKASVSLFEKNYFDDPDKFPTIELNADHGLVQNEGDVAIPNWQGCSASGLQAPIGRASATRSQIFAVGPVVRERSAHTMLVGKTGMGKSSMLHALILSLTHLYSPDELELYLLDFKGGVEFKDYAKFALPHAKVVAIQSDRELGLSVLSALNAEIDERSHLFRAASAQDLEGYRRETQKAMPRILAIIDEFQVIFSGDDKVAVESDAHLENLVRQGRSFGIHIFLASQNMSISASFSKDKIYDQMANRISLAVGENDIDRVFGQDNLAAKDLHAPGEAIYNHKGGSVSGNSKFQGALVTDEQKASCLKRIRQRFDIDFDEDRRPYVFEGAVNAYYKDYQAEFVGELNTMSKRSLAIRLLLGAPVSMRSPISVNLQRDLGNHMLCVGLDKEMNGHIVTSVLQGILISNRVRSELPIDVVLFNGVVSDDEGGNILERFCDTLKDEINLKNVSTKPKAIESGIQEIWQEVARRTESDEIVKQSNLILLNRLQGIKKFRAPDTDFLDMSFDEPEGDSVSLEKMIKEIIEDGPSVGVHFCIIADSVRAFNGSYFKRYTRDFGFKIVHSLNPDDANDIFGDQKLTIVDRDRGYLYDYDADEMSKFKSLHLI